ncbi:hypothetical protein [Streptomyces eurythermus]
MEQTYHSQTHEKRDSDGGVQEGNVRTGSACQQQYSGTGVQTVHDELQGR